MLLLCLYVHVHCTWQLNLLALVLATVLYNQVDQDISTDPLVQWKLRDKNTSLGWATATGVIQWLPLNLILLCIHNLYRIMYVLGMQQDYEWQGY